MAVAALDAPSTGAKGTRSSAAATAPSGRSSGGPMLGALDGEEERPLIGEEPIGEQGDDAGAEPGETAHQGRQIPAEGLDEILMVVGFVIPAVVNLPIGVKGPEAIGQVAGQGYADLGERSLAVKD